MYYDKYYLKTLQNREDFSLLFNKIEIPAVVHEETANHVLAFFKKEFIS
jgi:hypothetical protein